MATKTIPDLQLISSVTDDVNLPGDNGIQTYRMTAVQLLAYILGAGKVQTAALNKNVITGQTDDTAPDPAADYLLSYDASADALKKIKLSLTRKLAIRTTTSGITASIDDDIILASGAALTISLPAVANSAGKLLVIKKTDSTVSNTITVDGNSTETIDGATTVVLRNQYDTLAIYCDGSQWVTVSRFRSTLYADGGSAAAHYAARAWVNFNGTGTVAIRNSGNVSSITDNGTGIYDINLTNAMPSTSNYAVVMSFGTDSGSTGSGSYLNRCDAQTSTKISIRCGRPDTGGYVDPAMASVVAFE